MDSVEDRVVAVRDAVRGAVAVAPELVRELGLVPIPTRVATLAVGGAGLAGAVDEVEEVAPASRVS